MHRRDRRLGLARMNPLELTLVELNGADDFHLAIKNIKVYGLETVEVAKFDVNFERQKAHVISRASPVVILGDYKMNGHLMIFPLNGHGLVNITLVEGLYDYELEWTMENRNGAEYAKIIKSSYDYQLGNMIYNFTNLMNGDERLSLELNKVLNDNWRVVNEELKNSIQKTLLTIHDNLFSMIFSHIPFRELFLD
ncbi:unnamed protein product [Phaedon cochleariae]|uniref:Uncharacterized protein n=1 Tax=Phaedon cochleariae TaxID=80249 RepID=A0A9P0DPJ6_PHACE|nr:unnamed protein product [Phaedon cochleariae]